MEKLNSLDDKSYVFGATMLVANKLNTLMDREMSQFDMTTKQWFLVAIIENLFDNPPTINEVAKAMGYSHQNIKQIALNLEKKGFLVMEKDKKDGRATRLKLTEKNYLFWEKSQSKGNKFKNAVFSDISEQELNLVRRVIGKVRQNLEEIGNE